MNPARCFLCCIYAVRPFRKLLIIKVEVDVQLVLAVDIQPLF